MVRIMHKGVVLAVVTAGLLLVPGARAWANAIQSVNVSQGPDKTQLVKIAFDEALSRPPIHFATTTPNRVVLDFPGVQNPAGRISAIEDKGVVHSYSVVNAADRTRVVLDLAGPASYDLRQEKNVLFVVLQASKPSPDNAAGGHFASASTAASHTVRDVAFRRGAKGEGRVEITLSDPGVGIDIKQKGQAIQVDFLNTALPPELQRRLDVSEFATAAQSVESYVQGKNTRLVVNPRGKWDFFAYQTGKTFVIEVTTLDGDAGRGAERPRYTGEKLTLDFQDVEVRAVLKVIADFTGLNIIAAESVAGSITLRLKDVPWDQALDIILRTKGLDKRVTGNVIWIAPREELAAKEKQELEAREQLTNLEELQTEIVRLNYLRANEAQSILLGKSVSQIQAGEKVTCSAQAVGVGGRTQAAAGSSAGPEATSILSKRGKISFDLKSNSLFIQDTPAKLLEARKLLTQIDVPSRQIMIEARVVVANDSFSRTLGARLGLKAALFDNMGLSTTANDAASIAAGGLGSSTSVPFNVDLPAQVIGGNPGVIGFSIIEGAGNALLGLELQALEADKRGKIISSPRVITQNQQPAVILQGTQIPAVTPGTDDSPATVTYKDAFLCLLVDPQVLNNDEIILNVEVQKDAPGESFGLGGGGFAFPINTKRVKTQVRVKNGETAVLGGIFEQDLANDTEKVPLLGDLPVLGYLFRTNLKRDVKTELMIFLTPRLLEQGFTVQ